MLCYVLQCGSPSDVNFHIPLLAAMCSAELPWKIQRTNIGHNNRKLTEKPTEPLTKKLPHNKKIRFRQHHAFSTNTYPHISAVHNPYLIANNKHNYETNGTINKRAGYFRYKLSSVNFLLSASSCERRESCDFRAEPTFTASSARDNSSSNSYMWMHKIRQLSQS